MHGCTHVQAKSQRRELLSGDDDLASVRQSLIDLELPY